MTTAQDVVQEKSHYEKLYLRDANHHFIGDGYESIHALTVDLLEPNSHVIDMGCGSGHHSLHFARKGHRVSGVELSETAIESARRLFADAGLDGEFLRGDVRQLPYPERSFDAAFLSLILHHFLDYEPVLEEAARVSGRYLFVFEPNAWNPQSFLLLNVINPLFAPSFLSPNQRAVSPRKVEQILRRRGFRLTSRHFLTIGSTSDGRLLKRLVYSAQRLLPGFLRHNKFVQVFERI